MSVQENGKPPPGNGVGSASSSAGSGTYSEDSTPPESGKRTFRYSFVDGAADNDPDERESTLAELVELFEDHGETVDQKDGPAFCPATFEGKRRKSNVESLEWLALDLEETEGTVDELQGVLTEYRRVTYSTRSHGLRETDEGDAKWRPGEPRFRMLVPLKRPVDAEEYAALWSHVYNLLDEGPDRTARDTARLMYTPRTRHPRAERDTWIRCHDDAPLLDPDALPDGNDGAVSADTLKQSDEGGDTELTSLHDYRTPVELTDSWVDDALEAVPPDGCDCEVCSGYETWRNVGFALRSEFGDEAFARFDKWSSGGDKYEGTLDCRQFWNSFGDIPAGEMDREGVSLGTIWHLAEAHGWTPSPDAYPTPSRPDMLDPFEGVDPISLEEGRATIRESVADARDRRKRRFERAEQRHAEDVAGDSVPRRQLHHRGEHRTDLQCEEHGDDRGPADRRLWVLSDAVQQRCVVVVCRLLAHRYSLS